MTKKDWQTVNHALALLQAEHESEEPDEWAPSRDHAAWRRSHDRLDLTRHKVHRLIEMRAGDPRL